MVSRVLRLTTKVTTDSLWTLTFKLQRPEKIPIILYYNTKVIRCTISLIRFFEQQYTPILNLSLISSFFPPKIESYKINI